MTKTYLRFPGFKLKAFTMSYDDGVRQDKRLVQIMKTYGLKGTFNINSGLFEESPNRKTESGRMSESEAIALLNGDNTEVAVHGFKHFSLAEMGREQSLNDVLEDRKTLEKTFGKIVKGMAYPNGSVSDSVVEILKNCGINYCRTVRSTHNFEIGENWLKLDPTCHHNDPRLMELAEKFVNLKPETNYWGNRPQMFYLWGHAYEFDDNNNWEVIENFAKFISNRNDIWYATNGEIYSYVKAVESLDISVDGSIIHNPSAITVYINYLGKQLKIASGETVKI